MVPSAVVEARRSVGDGDGLVMIDDICWLGFGGKKHVSLLTSSVFVGLWFDHEIRGPYGEVTVHLAQPIDHDFHRDVASHDEASDATEKAVAFAAASRILCYNRREKKIRPSASAL
jgi:hypothetical protein